MNVIEFENQLREIVGKYPQEKENEWIFELYLPMRRKPITAITGNTLNDLFEYLDLSKLDAMGVWFSKKVIEDNSYYYFGASDTNKLAIAKASGEVFFMDEEGEILYILAEDLSDYLSIFVAFAEYSIKGYFGHKFDKQDRSDLLSLCKKIVKSEKCFPYYEEHFSF